MVFQLTFELLLDRIKDSHLKSSQSLNLKVFYLLEPDSHLERWCVIRNIDCNGMEAWKLVLMNLVIF